MEKKQPIIISRDLANVIKSFLVPQLKFVKITYDNGLKERSVNFNDVIAVDFGVKNISCIGEKIDVTLHWVIELEKIKEIIIKFMVKITDNFYVRNLNDIKLVEKTENGSFRMYFSSATSRTYSLTKSEASVFGF